MINTVHPGWIDAIDVPHLGSPRFRILVYEGGEARFEHVCDRGERGVVLCAPALAALHEIVQVDPALSIMPSILCPDCGLHGYVRDGRWVSA